MDLYVEIHDSSSYDDGVEVTTIGVPYNSENYEVIHGRLTSDEIRSSRGPRGPDSRRIFNQNIQIISMDITVYTGISGAPVFYQGRLLGVISASLHEGRGLAWAIPLTYLLNTQPARTPRGQHPGRVRRWPRFNLMNPETYRSFVSEDRPRPLPTRSRFAVRIAGGSTWQFLPAATVGVSWLRQNHLRSVVYGVQSRLNTFGHSQEYQVLSGVPSVVNSDREWTVDAGFEVGINLFRVRPEAYLNFVFGPSVQVNDSNEIGFHSSVHLGVEISRGIFVEISNSLVFWHYEDTAFTHLGEPGANIDNRNSVISVLGVRYEI